MAKIDYEPKTLDDKIIRDGLCAVSTLVDNPASKGLYFVVGGIAAQSYLPSLCRRGTNDIDVAVLKRLNKEDFKEFSRTASEFLRDNGYTVSHRKTQGAFCVDFEDPDGTMSFIEFPRFSEKRFEEKYPSLQSEKEHAKRKIIEGTNRTYIVASPEDIIVPKLVRAVNSLKRNPLFEEYLRGMKELTDQDIQAALKKISELRREVLLSPGDIGGAEVLRFVSDLYDIRMLSEQSGINDSYFRQSANSWKTLRVHSNERDLIARSNLPDDLFLDDHVRNLS